MGILDILVFGTAVFLGAASGGIFRPGDWYTRLNKPGWTPKDWVFPVVWSFLYLLIAAAGVLVWRNEGFGLALGFWIAQLVVNSAWSWLMFGIRRIEFALIDAGLMLVFILAFMAAAWPGTPIASLLFVPYLVWVTLAFVLNLRVLQMNPDWKLTRA